MNKLDTMLEVGRSFGVRNGMLRLQYELQRVSGLMSRKMRTVQGWDSWRPENAAPGFSVDDILSSRRDGVRPFFFCDARTLGAEIRKVVGFKGEQSVLAQAERILKGELPFFGQLSFDCGFPPRWLQNPGTGQSVSPRQSWTHMRFASPIYGDLKFILEPSRFLFIYPLVRAYALSGDDRFPQAFWSALEDWILKNPPMDGPLWICGQESSLRILGLSFALHAFINSPSTTSKRTGLLVSMIAAHAWRTAQTLGYARSQRSNHLITEAVGLWTAGTLYPELRDAQDWQNLGARLLRDAVLDQITPQGVSHQHSFNYQRMILQLLLWTLRLAEIHRSSIHEDIRTRTQSAYDFMNAWVDPISGLVPNFGSDDGSLIFPLADASYRDFRPLRQLGAAVLDRPPLNSGPWDEAALWFGAKPTFTSADKKAVAEENAFCSPPHAETGYFRLGDGRSWALIRAGAYTRRPFQADQLHVDLWCHGINIARDPGTYLYNGAFPWNNGLAGTAVQNTVSVDNEDQMRRAGRFLWVDWAQGSGRAYSSDKRGPVDRFVGQHDGYQRFGVTHRRLVQWLAGNGWVIVDDIEGTGEHDVRLHWLVAELPFHATESPFHVGFDLGSSKVRWNVFSNVAAQPSLIRAGKKVENFADQTEVGHQERMGWEAPTYGALQPAISLIHQTRSQLPVRFVTAVLTNERCKVEARRGEIVVLEETREDLPHESVLYRVNLSATAVESALDRSLRASAPVA